MQTQIPLMQKLSSREYEVFQELVRGKFNKEIASHLYISEDTVKKHLKSIYKKLEVRNRVEAVTHNQQEGLYSTTATLTPEWR